MRILKSEPENPSVFLARILNCSSVKECCSFLKECLIRYSRDYSSGKGM